LLTCQAFSGKIEQGYYQIVIASERSDQGVSSTPAIPDLPEGDCAQKRIARPNDGLTKKLSLRGPSFGRRNLRQSLANDARSFALTGFLGLGGATRRGILALTDKFYGREEK
jgi:hypothetical protein